MKEKKEDLAVEEIKRQKEETDRLLLRAEVVLGLYGVTLLLVLWFIAILTPFVLWLKILLMVFALVAFLVDCFICLKFEQKAGYYECAECHEKYVPTYSQVAWSMHMGRTRYMKCPHCNKKSWHKKVLK